VRQLLPQKDTTSAECCELLDWNRDKYTCCGLRSSLGSMAVFRPNDVILQEWSVAQTAKAQTLCHVVIPQDFLRDMDIK
jgi:hypothetical protein